MTLRDYATALEALRRRGKASAVTALAQLEAIIARVTVIAGAVADYEAQRAERVAVPFYEVTATVGAIETFIATYFDDLDYPPDLFSTLRATQRALFDLGSLRRAFASQTTLTSGRTNVFVQGSAPLTPYRLRQGDTLERIARETLGNVERAWEILDLNNLAYPYLLTDRSVITAEFSDEFDPTEFRVETVVDRTGVADGVLVTGETLWLPSDAVVPTTAQLTDRDTELWGRDIAVVNGLVQISDDGELVTVEAAENIVQALGQRISVTRGELVLHPEYGIERLLTVGVEGTEANALFAGMEVARTVRQDPRVTSVPAWKVIFEDTVNSAALIVSLIGSGQAQVPLNLVIPNVVGGG